jgi:putative Mg2+ transporter-C (MgtC) family protein
MRRQRVNIMEIDVLGWTFHLDYLRDLFLAYLLAFPVAFNREREGRSAGLRTFPLVALGSCAYLLIGRDLFGNDPGALARVVYGLMTGIGFISGGAIVKEGGTAHGTATAATIWSTGAIGAAVAFHRFEVAVLLTFLNFFTLLVFKPIKSLIRRKHRVRIRGSDSDEGRSG